MHDGMLITFFLVSCVFAETVRGCVFFSFFRNRVDKTVSLNDSNCYWQSICSGEIVHRASFLTGDCVFEATSGGR